MNVTFPTITFPKRGAITRDAFVLAQETAQDIISNEFTNSLKLFVEQATLLEQNVTTRENTTIVYSNNASTSATNANNYKLSALSYSNIALEQANIATQKANEIQGYVIPSGASYSISQIDALIRDNIALEQFLNFNIGV